MFSFSGVAFWCPKTSSRVVRRAKSCEIHYFGALLPLSSAEQLQLPLSLKDPPLLRFDWLTPNRT